ncbi:hypothetical protein [Poriferisphaera sp. WC338]|uniref:hypothetical protein n=1 Tax=Poriferisphaera sp. WC338 TaxID=3425129 RepID=UPI003D81AE35
MRLKQSKIVLLHFHPSGLYARGMDGGVSQAYQLSEGEWWSEALLREGLAEVIEARGLCGERVACFVPASWCLYDYQSIPITSGDQLHAAIKLQSQQVLEGTGEAFVKDCQVDVCEREAAVHYAAMQRGYMDVICGVLEAARNQVRLVTPTLHFVHEFRGKNEEGGMEMTVLAGRDYVEVILRESAGEVRVESMMVEAGGVVERVAAYVQQYRLLHASDDRLDVKLVTEEDVDAGEDERLIDVLGGVGGEVRRYGVGDVIDCEGVKRAVQGDAVYNFVSPRLDRLPVHVNRWRVLLGSLAAVCVLVFVVLGVMRVVSIQSDMNALRGRIESLDAQRERAESMIRLVDEAERWYGREPEALECLLALTLAYKDIPDIWLGRFDLDAGRSATIVGEALSDQYVLGLVEKMNRDSRFDDVQILDIQNNTKRQGRITYNIRFHCKELVRP